MKKIKLITIILIIISIILVSFFGIYIQVQNRMENQVKEYNYAMDLDGTRNLRLRVSELTKTTIKDEQGNVVEETEELTDEEIAEQGYTKEETPYNSEEIKNEENYNNSKNIIEKRLQELGVDNYTIKVDKGNGDIILELTENDRTDNIVSNIYTTGKFEIVDSQTDEVLINNDDIKLSNVMYGSGSETGAVSAGTAVYLNIELTKEGTKKLEDISNTYVTITQEENTQESEENTENTESTEQKEITMKIDDEEIMSTSFEEPLKTGKLQLSIGSSSTDQETINGYIEQASNMAIVLDTGNMPLKYDVEENQYVLSDITNDKIQILKYAIMAIVLIALIVLVIRYKLSGLLGAISYIGLGAILLLIIRYANVILSIEGIFGITIILILNYIFINKLLNKEKHKEEEKTLKEVIKESYKEFFIKIIPIIIMVITFCFIQWVPISSFGMVMFWGITLIAIYNAIITNSLLKIKASK